MLSRSSKMIDIEKFDRDRVLSAAAICLSELPITITSCRCPRSAGDLHDFYSEGDYWWPDPVNPARPYIRRDGMSNPSNFSAHRHMLVRLSMHVAALTSAWLLTNDPRFSRHAARHLH